MKLSRLIWIMITSPLAAIFALTCLATFPAVLDNNFTRLVLILYVVLCPILLVFIRARSVVFFNVIAALLTLQVISVGFVNFWFKTFW